MTLLDIAQLTEDQAREYIEAIRWPDGPVCPHCGHTKIYALHGKAHRPGLYKCAGCRKQFTVKVGSIMEDSRISYLKWLMAMALMTSSKKGFSAHQLHRTLGVTYKTAWFMFHRIRHAMGESPDAPLLSGTVEVDETYVGGKPRHRSQRNKRGRGTPKTPVVALVERSGRVRSRSTKRVDAASLKGAIRENVDRSSRIMTDEFRSYHGLGAEYASHETVTHSAGEYSRGDVYTNTVESYFALLKRGVHGTFHHVSKAHIDRYCQEFSFRWNHRKATDGERMDALIRQTGGKRLTYQEPLQAVGAA